jgi:hypothetical protein
MTADGDKQPKDGCPEQAGEAFPSGPSPAVDRETLASGDLGAESAEVSGFEDWDRRHLNHIVLERLSRQYHLVLKSAGGAKPNWRYITARWILKTQDTT